MFRRVYFALLVVFVNFCLPVNAQVSYGTAASWGLRKTIPSYTAAAFQVRRTCDNGSTNIPFTSCGDLDTVFLKAFVVAANPLSAMSLTSTTAYSLRRLRCSYPGNAIRVRSSAAGTPTMDIGFTPNGDLDTATLKTFIGANSGFVTIWYDQSSNGWNASQNTNGSQPRIVNAGVVERQGIRPAIRWLGNGYSLNTSAFTAYSSAASFNGVVRVATNVTYNTFINKTSSNFPAPLDLYNGQMVIGAGSSYNFFGYGQTLNASLPHSIWTYDATSGGNYNFYYNGALTASGTVGFYGDLGNPLVIGSRADGVTGLNGWISECLTFNSVPTATDRLFLEWSQSAYYQINGPNLTSLPLTPASGFVHTWYDQSGNGKNISQATASLQPLIIQSGSILKQNALPAIQFNGSSTALQASDAGLPTGNLAITGLVKANTLSTYGSILHYGSNSNGSAVYAAYGSDGNFGSNAVGLSQFGDAVGIANSVGNSLIFSSIRSGSNYSVFSNGGSLNSKTMLTNTSLYGANGLSIGSFNASTGGGFLDGSISELSLFSSSLSVTRRFLIETNYAAYTSTTVSNNKYTPPSPGTYNRFVNGVGRQTATDSVAGTRSTVGMGVSIGTSGTDFLKDNGDYLTFGVNCPISIAASTLNLPGSVVLRWYNDWYLNKTDVNSNNGTITFFFDFSDYGVSVLPGTASNYELLARSSPASNFTIVTGVTKSIVGDRVLFSVDAANIPTNFYYTLGTQNMNASPLPIELVSFEATCEASAVKIDWITASQKNNDYFSIERTRDGLTFETISTITARENTNERRKYSYEDLHPLNGTSYYRLKQTDLNGTETLYNYQQVNCLNKSTSVTPYPNPANGTFRVEGLGVKSKMSIINAMGVKVMEQDNVISGQAIDCSQLTPGIYFVELSGLGHSPSLKLVIQY